MIDWNKPVRTVGDHRSVHVVAVTNGNKPGDKPYVLISTWDERTKEWNPVRRCNLDGMPMTHGSEIENIPERTSRFVNVYPNSGYMTLEDAKEMGGQGYLGTVEAIIENDKIVEVKNHG